MKKLLLILLCLLPLCVAQAQKHKTTPKKQPTLVSVADILPNYGLDTTMVNDTSAVLGDLASRPQDYVALTNYCVEIRMKVLETINSIENDYLHQDSIIWIDSNTVLSDYSIYEYRLRRLADLMGRMSIRYSRLEQQRVEAEKEAARQRAIEEARRQQEARDKEATGLRENIDLHHRAIIKACDGTGEKDKNRLKWLKDLYYSYLMVYNKYDLSTGHATPESIAQLDELNSFQNDLLESVLGPNSFPSQIDNFKNILKVRCGKDNSDVFRSYSRVFKQQNNVPISFADVTEYGNYIDKLQNIISVQNRYLQTLDLRASIKAGTDQIVQLYGKKYREVVNAYKEVENSLDKVPAFTNKSESINFIYNLEEFISAQQRYLDDYKLLEDISRRSDSILNGKENKFRDVMSAYRDVKSSLVPVPSFKSPAEATRYEEQLADVVKVQQCYMQVITQRNVIERNDDSLMSMRKVDRRVYNGYRLFRKQADLQPSFSTIERGLSFLDMLNSHIEMQKLCLHIMQKRRTIESNDDRISNLSSSFRNISKAYSRMLKVYDDFGDIENNDDLHRYDRQCDGVIEMQQAFQKLLESDIASSTDMQLKRETDIERIKAAVGLK